MNPLEHLPEDMQLQIRNHFYKELDEYRERIEDMYKGLLTEKDLINSSKSK